MGSRETDHRTGPKVDPRERFSGAAGGYARSRPGYPPPLVDWVVREARVGPGETVLDLGCGTGILTRALAERGLRVVAVDPNEDMIAQARVAGGAGIDYRRGDAEGTGFGTATASTSP